MRLSLTGPEHLEPPTTVPRLPACWETPPRGHKCRPWRGYRAAVVHSRRLARHTRSDIYELLRTT